MQGIYSIKETVTVLTITKQLQKIKFQIRHPENVEGIIGIAVTTDKISEPSGGGREVIVRGDTVGYLTLSHAGKGEMFYGEDVRVDNNDYADIVEKSLGADETPIMYALKRGFYLQTNIEIDKAVIDGFYQDIYSPALSGYDGLPLRYLYKVRIYLRYKIKEKETNQQES